MHAFSFKRLTGFAAIWDKSYLSIVSAICGFSLINVCIVKGQSSPVLATDNAGNYTSDTSWNATNGPSLGSGFGNWSQMTNTSGGGYAGSYLASGTNIDTSGEAFALYANGGTSPQVTATRGFNTSLVSGDAFHITMQNNGIQYNNGLTNGSEGFTLNTADGAALTIGFDGGDSDWYISDGTSLKTLTSAPYASSGIVVNVVATGSNTYNTYLTEGTTTYSYIGRSFFTGSGGGPLINTGVYDTNSGNGGTGNGGDFYFNNLQEVSSPTYTGATGNFSSATNWQGNYAATNGDNVIFSGTSGGTVTNDALGAVNSIAFASGAGAYVLNGSTNFPTFAIASNGTTTVINSSANVQTINANLALGTNAVIDAGSTANGSLAVTGKITGGFGLAKQGSNALALSGANTYTGGTTISAGTLVANTTGSGNSATGTGTVTINTSGTLAGTGNAGNGSTGVVIVNGGKITAGSGATTGDSIGTLTTGAQNWSSGSYVAKVNSAGTSNDQLLMSGLTISASTGNPFTVALTGLSSVSPTLLTTAGIVLATDSNSGDAGVFQNAINAMTLVLSTVNITTTSGYSPKLVEVDPSGGGEELVAEAAPEPTSFLLLGAVSSPLLLSRRRRSTAEVSLG